MNIHRRGYPKFIDVKEERFVKIRQVNVYVVDTGSYQLVMAESITDEGITGIGEAAVGYGIGSAAAAAMIKELADAFVIGRDPFNITDIWNDFY